MKCRSPNVWKLSMSGDFPYGRLSQCSSIISLLQTKLQSIVLHMCLFWEFLSSRKLQVYRICTFFNFIRYWQIFLKRNCSSLYFHYPIMRILENYLSLTPHFSGNSTVKNLPASAGEADWIPGSGRSPGEGNNNPFQYPSLKNPMDRGGRPATVQRDAKSQTQLSN